MKRLPTPESWSLLCVHIAKTVRHKLATLLEVDWDAKLVRRIFSSDELHYPSGGEKRLMGSSWARHVLEDGRVFRASGPEEMQRAFADHELLASLGLNQAMNVPIWADSRVGWSLNLLRDEPPFDDGEVVRAQQALSAIQVRPCELDPNSRSARLTDR